LVRIKGPVDILALNTTCEAVLNGDLTALLLSQQSSNKSSLVTPLERPGDVIGYPQDWKWMQGNLESI
jgi:hypothetical protein